MKYNYIYLSRLEQEQKQLVERKEKELLEQLISQRSGGDVNLSELRSYVQVCLCKLKCSTFFLHFNKSQLLPFAKKDS